MLQKTTSIMIALAVSIFVLPVGASDEVFEKEYTALGAREGVSGEGLGFGVLMYPDTRDCHYWCFPINNLGGVGFVPERPYDHLMLDLDDGQFEDPASHICFYNPYGDMGCDEDDHSTGTACGSYAVPGPPFPTDDVVVFIYMIYVTPTYDVCMGSAGTMRATFS